MQLLHPQHQPIQSCLLILLVELCTAESDAEDYRQVVIKSYQNYTKDHCFEGSQNTHKGVFLKMDTKVSFFLHKYVLHAFCQFCEVIKEYF